MPDMKEKLTYLLANKSRIDAEGKERYAANFDESKHPHLTSDRQYRETP